MSQLASVIEKAANAFAREIIEAVKAATLQELLALSGGAPRRRGRPPKAKPGRKPGRPPKAKPGRKPGRPPKAAAKATAKKPVKKPAKLVAAKAIKKSVKKVVKAPTRKKRHINYPKCSVPGCGKNRYARGNGMCGEHFRAAKVTR